MEHKTLIKPVLPVGYETERWYSQFKGKKYITDVKRNILDNNLDSMFNKTQGPFGDGGRLPLQSLGGISQTINGENHCVACCRCDGDLKRVPGGYVSCWQTVDFNSLRLAKKVTQRTSTMWSSD